MRIRRSPSGNPETTLVSVLREIGVPPRMGEGARQGGWSVRRRVFIKKMLRNATKMERRRRSVVVLERQEVSP